MGSTLFFAAALALAQGDKAATEPAWQALVEGVEYARIQLVTKPEFGDGVLHVVRISPERAQLRAVLRSEQGGESRTAGEWADSAGLVVAINAGMFDLDDASAHVGYLRNGEHVNQGTWNAYKSAVAFGPTRPGAAPLAFVDLDSPEAKAQADGYRTVAQNLRLIRGEGRNVWPEQARRWSEAAIAADGRGRLLFLFSRSPLSMRELNRRVLAAPLGIVRAMHVEGGPEASLSIRAPALKLDLCGSYETGFNEDDRNAVQWPIPNVIGVAGVLGKGK